MNVFFEMRSRSPIDAGLVGRGGGVLNGSFIVKSVRDESVRDTSQHCKECFNSNRMAHTRRSAYNEWLFVHYSMCFIFFRVICFLLLK
jgi:hypothetical protein